MELVAFAEELYHSTLARMRDDRRRAKGCLLFISCIPVVGLGWGLRVVASQRLEFGGFKVLAAWVRAAAFGLEVLGKEKQA